MRKSTRIQVSLIVLSLAANALAVAAFAAGPAPRLVLDPGGHTAAVRKVLGRPQPDGCYARDDGAQELDRDIADFETWAHYTPTDQDEAGYQLYAQRRT